MSNEFSMNVRAYEWAKILPLFAFVGFCIGSVAYFIFSWSVTTYDITTSINLFLLISFLFFRSVPWFISGMAGALLMMIMIVVFARISGNKL